MTKAPVKFQKSQHKMVGGVAHFNSKNVVLEFQESDMLSGITKVKIKPFISKFEYNLYPAALHRSVNCE